MMTARQPFSSVAIACLLLAGCGDDAIHPSPDADGANIPGDEVIDDDALDTGPAPTTKPDWFPARDDDAEETFTLAGLQAPVRVVVDDRGYPHIYAENVDDLSFAQGFIMARYRLFQMETLRKAGSGALAELLGAGSLAGDIQLRMLKVRQSAELIEDRLKSEFPDTWAALEAFAAGVNHHIERVNAGEAPKAPEAILFQVEFAPWEPVDTLTIARLQSWDLAFWGYYDEFGLLETAMSLRESWDGTPLEGIERDVLDFRPALPSATDDRDALSEAEPVNVSAILDRPAFQKLRLDAVSSMAEHARAARALPHRAFSSGGAAGSNNWVVSGAHTASGRPIVANDPHLSLRNPSIFFNNHLSTVPAGGTIDANGRQFPGAPGVVLGHNAHGAWGATVFFSDVTDAYLETLTDDGGAVIFQGEEVPLTYREEVFRYRVPADGCDSPLGGWIQALSPVAQMDGDFFCQVTVQIAEVPHHGPIIPWSYSEDTDGDPIAFSWKWTGFEPTDDLVAIWRVMQATNVTEFQAAMDHFGCGAQNWIWGDVHGDIAWYPSHLLPRRAHVTDGERPDYPPFLPMPGDGSAEWDGFLDRDEIPHLINPERGWVATANADPTGISFDADPFNDGPYVGYTWAIGYRLGRIEELLEEHIDAGGITAQDMLDVQNDVLSPLGRVMAPHLLDALNAAQAGADPETTALWSPMMEEAMARLGAWDYRAAAGVDPWGVWSEDAGDDAEASIATSIFNAFLVHLTERVLADEGITDHAGSATLAKILVRMLDAPETMVTYDAEASDSRLWDDVHTEEVEGRDLMLVRALSEGLAFLSDPEKVGVGQAGGFGTDDMSQWRWGLLHTVTLVHNVTHVHNIPSSKDLPDGHPRHGDNYVVDVSNPGLEGTSFTYRHGPSIRAIYELTDTPQSWSVIPGGQHEDPLNAHYKDEMAHWVDNAPPPVPFALEDVLAARESMVDLYPAPDAD